MTRPAPIAPAAPFDYEALPGRVVFGRGSSRTALAEVLDDLGIERALVIGSQSELGRAPGVAAGISGRTAATFSAVRPHVPAEVAAAARAAAAEHGVDGLVAIGGGSTTGTAKIVALTTGLPIVAVPTTFSGSEMTPVWGITTEAGKQTGSDRRVLPRAVVYDPVLTDTLPDELAVASGFNALAHCVEAFWGPRANPVTALIAAEGIRVIASGLRGLDGGIRGARDALLFGAQLAGSSFATAGSGLHHTICHALGGAFDLAHAQTHAVMLPRVMEFNEAHAPVAAASIARALGSPTASAGLRLLARDLGAPRALSELGLTRRQLELSVPIVAARLPIANPRPVGEADIRNLLRAAFAGDAPRAD